MAKNLVILLLVTTILSTVLSSCSGEKLDGDATLVGGSTAATHRSDEFGLTIIPALMQAPRGLAFFRADVDSRTPNEVWRVTRLDRGSEDLGNTWGSYTINDKSGTGKGPAKDGEGFEIASFDLAIRAGDEIPILFDFRGLHQDQKIRISDGFGIQAEFTVSRQKSIFESPSQVDLCNSRMDLPPNALLRRIDVPVAGASFYKSNCSEIPVGVYEIRLGKKLLTYVRRSK
jgi:hypothetical protein